MELSLVIWLGAGVSIIAAFQFVHVERPTWGLSFVLMATGGFLGNQILADWAIEGSWVQNNGLGAGLVLSLLVYQLWLFAAAEKNNSNVALNRSAQTILVLGLLIMLLIAPPNSSIINILGIPIAWLTVAAMLLASLTLLADRCIDGLFSRLLLFTPLLLIVPALGVLLQLGQAPTITRLGDLFPKHNSYTPTGFAPRQQLRASAFLRPSNRAVMRVISDKQPNQYLVGNRLALLDEDLMWQPIERPLTALTISNAEALPNGELRYLMDNHQFSANNSIPQTLTVHSLARNNYIFMNPNTSHLTGRFDRLTKNAADVWAPIFDRGSEKRWKLESKGKSAPDVFLEENLQLPEFWDASLQEKSQSFIGSNTQQTVDNVLNHFISGVYSLETNFDPEQPFHDFYLNNKPAYCFWFATATTLALRANGIPARIVGGYVIHEKLSSDMWLVRQRDAHSWVEWQDASGYWHSIDPTPPSIASFFDGYQSNQLSLWYHRLAGQWQLLIERVLADEFTANLVRYSGLFILLFLFVREYRRLRGRREAIDSKAARWQKIWQRFLHSTNLPTNASWTASTYSENLPQEWPAAWVTAAKAFLADYNLQRFSDREEQALAEVEKSLEDCLQVISR